MAGDFLCATAACKMDYFVRFFVMLLYEFY